MKWHKNSIQHDATLTGCWATGDACTSVAPLSLAILELG